MTFPWSSGDVLTAADLNAVTKVLQVVSTSSTTIAFTGSTEIDSNLSLSITPTLATSKILVIAMHQWYIGASGTNLLVRIKRGATELTQSSVGGDATNMNGTYSMLYLDSPATTSATTYKTTIQSTTANAVYVSNSSRHSSIFLMEVAG